MKKMITAAALAALALTAQAQRIDINNSQNRTEEGYASWVIATTTMATTTVDGITIQATVDGQQQNRTLKGEWWKDGVNKYSKLTSDGVGVYGLEGNNTPQIQSGEVGITLTISGLTAGQHSLLAYHNNPSGYQGPKLDVYVDGTKVLEGVEQTNRAQTPDASGQSYIRFNAQEGQPVVVTYRTTPDPSTDYTQGYQTTSLFIDALVFDRPNPLTTASQPVPENNDEHADMDELRLAWTPASSAVSHHVLMGTDPDQLEWIGTTTDPYFELTPLNKLKTYYWRIDEETADGTRYEGDTWTFRPRRLAFPDAEGYGRFAIGGRGGSVYHVTSLDDDPSDPQPGTFRYGITKVTGPRTIVFDVAGVIHLKARLTCSDKYVTIAGQTAPGRGIMLRGAPFGMQSDGITRFLRMRLGYHNGDTDKGLDGLGMAGNDHAIMDHCSISWTIDEGFSSRNAKNITLQRTLISEALNIADHPNYPAGTAHGYAATIGGGENGGKGSSFHHNLLAHNEGRNWSISGGLDGSGAYDGHHDIFNNVVYNWGGRASDGGTHELNFVANYYKKGPATTQNFLLRHQFEGTGSGTQAAYVSGNIREETNGSLTTDQEGVTYKYELSGGQKLDWQPWASEPFFPSYATVESAEQAFRSVLCDVGCNQPELDNHDRRIVSETLSGTTSTMGSKSRKQGLIDRETDAEGFEGLNIIEATRPDYWDTDQDGLPDWYERWLLTSPYHPNNNENNLYSDYTDLEEYLNLMARPHFFIDGDGEYTIDLKPFFAGFSNFTVVDDGSYHGSPRDISWKIEGTKLIGSCWTNGLIMPLPITVTDGTYSCTRTIYCIASSEAVSAISHPLCNDKGEKATTPAALYNLQGQRLAAPQRGLNITQGRKYLKQ